jgi:hypothetical protein
MGLSASDFFGRSKLAQTTQTSEGKGWSEYFGNREDLTAQMHKSASREAALGTALWGINAIAAGAVTVGAFCDGIVSPVELCGIGATLLAADLLRMRTRHANEDLEKIRKEETRDFTRGWSPGSGGKAPPGYTPPVQKALHTPG